MSRSAVLIPLRGLHGGKSRLAPVLGPDERSAIIAAMAYRVIETTLGSGIADDVVVVTREPGIVHAIGIDPGRVTIVEQAQESIGLNAAIDLGRLRVHEWGVERLTVLSADLPFLERDDLEALDQVRGDVVLAADRTGSGTNGLSLRGPAAIASYRVHFGVNSHQLHRREAERLGLEWFDIACPGIAFDLDTPEDWQAMTDRVRRDLRRFKHEPLLRHGQTLPIRQTPLMELA